ncbi:ABC transporter permease [Lachnospiraceae bacterium MD1]|uniref:ABC transporter permease n=1 Tax=Variimorphobacter saccharofermentans TaxID=2755051 RepID=A0A839JYY2_9FIRM|nr:ABC transporter permease [Variimorphobacter saccharofermentans]MBB2182192.1 ABC transporter permease [Variimorphobacter saccharofermentans]
MDTRLRKVLRDLLRNKSKSILIILTMFVGMLSVGVVVMINTIFVPDVYKVYRQAIPKDASIKCSSGFDNSLLKEIAKIDGVKAATGTNRITVRLILDDGTLNADFIAFDGTNRIHKLKKGDDSDVLPELKANEVFIDRAAMKDIKKVPGDMINVQYKGQNYDFLIKDTVYDATTEPYMLEGDVISFVNQDTFETLTGDGRFKEINLIVEGDNSNKEYNLTVARRVADFMEANGLEIEEIDVPNPQDFYASEILEAVTIILVLLGSISVLLGVALIINNINNIMLQQTKYIGIMKAIGGQTNQLVFMYTSFILILGLIALLLSLPVSAFVGYQVSKLLAYMFNMSLSGFRIPPQLLLSLIASAIFIPLIASIIPIMKSSKQSIYHALYNQGISSSEMPGIIRHKRLQQFNHIPSLIRISLRNNLRNRVRVALTIATLALSGSIMLTVMNLDFGFKNGVEELKEYYIIDGAIILNSYENAQQIEEIVKNVEGVKYVEGCSFTVGRFLESNGKSSKKVKLMGPKPDSKIFNWTVVNEKLIDGRQIKADDANAVVITNHLIKYYPHLTVGDVITLKINNNDCDFHVVGIMNMAGQPTDPILLVNYSYLNSLLQGEDQVTEICISTNEQTEAYQQEVITKIEEILSQEGITIMETMPGADLLENFQTPITIIVALLMFLAIMLSIVGTIGQSGTLNLNVLERAKEFGIMRSVGATNRQLNMTIVMEGLILGIVAWIFAVILSQPLTLIANSLLGNLLFTTPMKYRISILGLLLWLFLSILSSCIASIMPCRKMNRMITREILAFE